MNNRPGLSGAQFGLPAYVWLTKSDEGEAGVRLLNQKYDYRPNWTTGCSFKVLANEDTMLRTHCCRHKCFPVCPRVEHLLRTQIFVTGTQFFVSGKQIVVSGTQNYFWFCSETFCVRNKLCFPVCTSKETSWATMFPQQCVLVCHRLYELIITEAYHLVLGD